MGVIIQRQVRASLSGVLFTVSPADPGGMLLEYCGGMGDALVSGAVNPGRVSIRRPARDTPPGAGGWTKTASPDDPAPAEAFLLNDVQIAKLTRLALGIERTLGAPQDIEWTIDGEGRLWIVQSRPITAGAKAGRPGGSKVQWSNANVNENFPQPISPLLYSVARLGYYHYFRNLGRAFGVSRDRLALMEPALRQIIGVHGARMYYNLTSIHSVLRSVPFGGALAGSFNLFVGAEDTAAARLGPGYRLKQALEIAVIAGKTTWQYLFLTRRVERFEATIDAYAAATHPDRLRDRPLPDLLADFRGFMDIRCHRWNNAALADAGAMVCYGLLQRLLARAFPGRDQQALHNSLLKALPNLVSSIPALKLWDLSRMARADEELRALFDRRPAAGVLEALRANPRFRTFSDALDGYLGNWGFRCSAELMLTVPSFQEDAAPLIDLLKAYIAMEGESPGRHPGASGARTHSRDACGARGAPPPPGVGVPAIRPPVGHRRHRVELDATVHPAARASAPEAGAALQPAAAGGAGDGPPSRGERTDRRPRRHFLPDGRRGRAAGVRRRDVPAPRQDADCPAAGRAQGSGCVGAGRFDRARRRRVPCRPFPIRTGSSGMSRAPSRPAAGRNTCAASAPVAVPPPPGRRFCST